MSVFDLLFLLLTLAAVLGLATAALQAMRGRSQAAVRIVRRVLVAAGAYLAIVATVARLEPRRDYRVGDQRCFDDWCITVVDAQPRATPGGTRYVVSLRLSNRARRSPMGEKGTVVYLMDSLGRRFDPIPDPKGIGFDTLLQPGASLIVERRFNVPPDARGLGLVYTHEGGFPVGWLVVGEGGWFQRPPIVRLQ
jgi:hypothetical protein